LKGLMSLMNSLSGKHSGPVDDCGLDAAIVFDFESLHYSSLFPLISFIANTKTLQKQG
jgi:hypothetical protein